MIADYAAAGVAANTRRAYASQARRWADWTADHNLDPVAGLTDAGLAAYLSNRADQGAAPATLAQAVAALRQTAQAAGSPNLTGPAVQAVMRGALRTGRSRGQIQGVRWANLEVQVTNLKADADGSGRLTVRRLKTDQNGRGAVLRRAADKLACKPKSRPPES